MVNNYIISLTKKAEKFIKGQDKVTQIRIVEAINALPRGDLKKLKGVNELYRLRVGDFRILFEKFDAELRIIIIEVGNRGQIYK